MTTAGATLTTPASTAPERPALRPLALPTEHGAWGFVSEPVLVAACLVPPAATLALTATAFLGFLLRHPLKLAAGDYRRGRSYPRTRWALGIAALYALGAAVALSALVALTGRGALLAVALPLPLLCVQFAYNVRQRGRELVPEALGTLAPGALVAGLLLALGWPLGRAAALWALLALRGLASVIYVRARLRRSRGLPAGRTAAWAWHAAGLLLAAVLAQAALGPWLAVLAFLVLLARSLHGLTVAAALRPQVVGFQELGYGLGSALLFGLGYAFGL